MDKIKIINTKQDKNLCFDIIEPIEIISKIKLIPIGANEVLEYNSYLPILIYGNDYDEFVIYSGIENTNTMFKHVKFLKIPNFIQAYPFFSVQTQDESSVIAIYNDKNIGKDKKYKIFENENLSNIAQNKINIVQSLYEQRQVNKNIIKELKKYDLLKKHQFKINNNKKELIILDNYYIVNEEKLSKLSDEVLALWAKKGWLGIINAHLHSINNFNKLLQLIKIK